MRRKIVYGTIGLLIIIQFIRPTRNLGIATTDKDIMHTVRVPDTIAHILIRSCYDCHSNHTDYPWYTNINPVGWWMNNHVKEGKRSINFSDLSVMTKRKLDHRFGDISETVEKKEMPLPSYTWIHKYAILEDGQIELVKQWADAARKEIGYHE
jgi:Haem-binding domain